MGSGQVNSHEKLFPAHELLFACARIGQDEPSQKLIRGAVTSIDDWEAFLGLCWHHQVSPLVAKNLLAAAEPMLADTVVKKLSAVRAAISLRAIQLLSELMRLIELFERNGIQVVPLKGSGVALQLYGDVGLRSCGDIDLLINPADLRKVTDLMRADGYEEDLPVWRFGSLRHRIYMRGKQEKAYRKTSPDLMVEIHWRLHPVDSLLTATDAGIPHEMMDIPVGESASIPVLRAEYQMLYLLTHGARHGWNTLKTLCDLPPLIAQLGSLDKVYKLAEERELVRPFGQGVLLAHEFLGAPVEAQYLEMARSDPAIVKLVEWSRAKLLLEKAPDSSEQISVNDMLQELQCHLLLKKPFRFKLDVLRQVYWRDNHQDQDFVDGPLVYLYFLFRPIFWAVKRGRIGLNLALGRESVDKINRKQFAEELDMDNIKKIAKKMPLVPALNRVLRDGYSSFQLKSKSTEDVFTEIFRRNAWRGKKSVSGTGSDADQTETIVNAIPELFSQFGIEKVLDVPCGDWHWMRAVDLTGIEYIGGDIVTEIVDRNNYSHGCNGVRFMKLDLISEKLPEVDLLLCRDCLVHFSFKDIFSALKNISNNNNCEYILTTTFSGRSENHDIVTGQWRPLNLEVAPFAFPRPLALITEGCTEGKGANADKALGLWRLADLQESVEIFYKSTG